MKRFVIAALVALSALLAVPATAEAAPRIHTHPAPAGATIRYDFESSSKISDISYYKDGKLVTRNNVRFITQRISFGAYQKYDYTVTFRTKKPQRVGSRVVSRESYARCALQINGRTVDGRTHADTGIATC